MGLERLENKPGEPSDWVAYIKNKNEFGEVAAFDEVEEKAHVFIESIDPYEGRPEYEVFELPYSEIVLYEKKEVKSAVTV